MHAISQFAGDFPDWQAGAEHRLKFSMVLAAAILAGILSLVRLPPAAQIGPLLELVVELTRPAPLEEPEPEVLPPPVLPEIVEEQTPPSTAPESVPEPVNELPTVEQQASGEGAAIDWEVERDEAIKIVLDAMEREASFSVNPPFERARAEASIRFRASLAPEDVPAWERVEKDQLGRTILPLGDGTCFRVLDDPSGVRQWEFQTFDQHMVYCTVSLGGGKKGRELPWVEIIRERYPYLRDPVEIN